MSICQSQDLTAEEGMKKKKSALTGNARRAALCAYQPNHQSQYNRRRTLFIRAMFLSGLNRRTVSFSCLYAFIPSNLGYQSSSSLHMNGDDVQRESVVEDSGRGVELQRSIYHLSPTY